MQNLEIEVLEASKKISELKNEISQKIVWQKDLVDSIIICLLWWGHILLEWLPGLAKTLTISTVSKCLDLGFSRVQFTPDLLPSDLIWTEIFNVKTSNFDIKKWPIFSNFVLEEPFLVLATQNPIEQSGTYKLPEAQLDRFALKVKVDYPSFEEEKEVYKNIISWQKVEIKKILSKSDIFQLQGLVKNIFVSDAIFDYVSRIVDATRNPEKYWLEKYKKYISFWVSPRWGLSLLSSAKALAFMEERSFVIPEDIKKLAISTLAHRLVLSYEAIADEIDEYFLIEKIISKIKIS